jgi:hypothetical protein
MLETHPTGLSLFNLAMTLTAKIGVALQRFRHGC